MFAVLLRSFSNMTWFYDVVYHSLSLVPSDPSCSFRFGGLLPFFLAVSPRPHWVPIFVLPSLGFRWAASFAQQEQKQRLNLCKALPAKNEVCWSGEPQIISGKADSWPGL